jgi:pimeloyl-ACP methyl ester carboxylesterase
MAVVKDAYATANGLRLHYRDWGGSGRGIVLLHGLASNARIWDLVAPALTGVGRVIALDQRGHGLSDRPDDGYSFDDVTADLAGVVNGLGMEAPVIAGHSWGASVAVCFAAGNPDRAAGIALVDGGTFGRSPRSEMTLEQFEQQLAPPRYAGTPRTRFLERVSRGDLRDLWSPELEAIVMAGQEVFPDDTIAPRLSFERHMHIVRALWDYHVAELLPRITCPVLVMPAIRDGNPEWTERKRAGVAQAEALNPRVRTVWLEDSIHDVPLQRPALVAETIASFILELDHAAEAAAGK